MIWLQRDHEQGLSVEGRLIYHYALMEGLPTRFFTSLSELHAITQSTDLVVGSVEAVSRVMQQQGIPVPEPDYYPLCLHGSLGRTVKKTTWAEALKQAATEPVFVKSHQWKRLTGMVMRPGEQMGTLAHSGMVDDDPVWVSDLVAFRSEHRVYVVHDTIVAVSQYGEEPDDDGLDLPLIQQAVALMSGYAPRQAYAFDWGILQSGETILIENNDAWAIGAYPGISPVAYYHLLNERWKELVSTSLSLQENNDGQA